VLGDDLDNRVAYHPEAVQHPRGDHGQVARVAGPPLVADPDQQLALQDADHLVAGVGVDRAGALLG
jgi:hypothetical protein